MVKGLFCLQVIVTGKVTRSRDCFVYKSCHHTTGKVRRSRDCFVYKSLSQVKSHGHGIVLFTSHVTTPQVKSDGQGIVLFTSHCHHATGKVTRSRDCFVYKSLSPRHR